MFYERPEDPEIIGRFQALSNAPGQQMSLNEIYTWFTDSFAFYRNNPHSWKVIFNGVFLRNIFFNGVLFYILRNLFFYRMQCATTSPCTTCSKK